MNIPILSDILRFLLDIIYKVIPNYGWTIVTMTVLIKLLMLPLDIKQRKGMKKQMALQDKLNKIKAKYKNDQELIQRKISELYTKEKINPMSGCLPMILQLLILMAMFYVFRVVANEQSYAAFEAVKAGGVAAYQPEGWLWIKNIWQPDSFFRFDLGTLGAILSGGYTFAANGVPVVPDANFLLYYMGQSDATTALMEEYTQVMAAVAEQFFGVNNGFYILPILAVGTQVFSTKMMQKQNPVAADGPGGSTNKILMYMMPVLSLIYCSTGTSSFSLYWVTSNVMSFVQPRLIDFFMLSPQEKLEKKDNAARLKQQKLEQKQKLREMREREKEREREAKEILKQRKQDEKAGRSDS